ncbi:hypothetical protein KGF54_002115 [Candida jiufengensis]|uniref:uncharacterized protein n=1 Tax=Candida jiufengensis TaxID=497108 RepID=UPI0022252964|nr:uncharacterized protein KGF54_002115 [Candida jiufengensis]KAI5954340.1 hypothetical protein KGF54_002115 [Candida jiufengensis]
MGHSTGCQNSIHYLTKHLLSDNSKLTENSNIDGIILQASVSDQEAISSTLDPTKYESLIQEVQNEYIAKGKSNDILPEKFRKTNWGVPITAYRFNSLFSKRGDDDFFSSYLTDEELGESFGKISKPLLLVYSGSDQFVPASIDKKELVSRFQKATPIELWSKYSKIIDGGSHNLGDDSENDQVIDELINAVTSFIENGV